MTFCFFRGDLCSRMLSSHAVDSTAKRKDHRPVTAAVAEGKAHIFEAPRRRAKPVGWQLTTDADTYNESIMDALGRGFSQRMQHFDDRKTYHIFTHGSYRERNRSRRVPHAGWGFAVFREIPDDNAPEAFFEAFGPVVVEASAKKIAGATKTL